MTDRKIIFNNNAINLLDSVYYISGPKNCRDSGANYDGKGFSSVKNSCYKKSRLIGYDYGKYFDDYEELNLGNIDKPLTKMVFWRYTCSRPCLGKGAKFSQ